MHIDSTLITKQTYTQDRTIYCVNITIISGLEITELKRHSSPSLGAE